MAFRDRMEAGRLLAERLKPYQREEPLLLALPRGGVPVAAEIARQLHWPLDVLVVRKIGAPFHEELAVGAVGPGDVLVLNREVIEMLNLSLSALEPRIERARLELERRLQLFRGDRSFPELAGRTVVLVDDGLATGATAQAAIQTVCAMKAGKVVLAVPVGAQSTVSDLRPLVDELVCLERPEAFQAVSLWYEDFPQNTDKEVLDLLREAWNREASGMEQPSESWRF